MRLHIASALIVLAVGLAPTSAAQITPTPLAEDTKPLRASGLGLTVSNLERPMKFYTEILGLQVDSKVAGKDGKVVEYLLGMTGNVRADTLIVLRQGEVVAGAAKFCRIVLVVPSGRKMAERLAANGYPPARIVDGTNIVQDPDGYMIELYQRPAATP